MLVRLGAIVAILAAIATAFNKYVPDPFMARMQLIFYLKELFVFPFKT
jgi:hypothetical protein